MATLSFSSQEIAPEALQSLVQEFERAVNSETDVEAHFPKSEQSNDERGSGIDLGVIFLTFLSSGTAVALFEIIKAFFARNSSIELSIEKNGSKFAFSATNLSQDRMNETLEAFKRFVAEQNQ